MKEDISDDHILDLLGAEATHERGFRLLMTRYQEPLYRHVRRMLYDHDDTNDVIQNTFIKFLGMWIGLKASQNSTRGSTALRRMKRLRS